MRSEVVSNPVLLTFITVADGDDSFPTVVIDQVFKSRSAPRISSMKGEPAVVGWSTVTGVDVVSWKSVPDLMLLCAVRRINSKKNQHHECKLVRRVRKK